MDSPASAEKNLRIQIWGGEDTAKCLTEGVKGQ